MVQLFIVIIIVSTLAFVVLPWTKVQTSDSVLVKFATETLDVPAGL